MSAEEFQELKKLKDIMDSNIENEIVRQNFYQRSLSLLTKVQAQQQELILEDLLIYFPTNHLIQYYMGLVLQELYKNKKALFHYILSSTLNNKFIDAYLNIAII